MPEEREVRDEYPWHKVFHVAMKILDGTIRDVYMFRSALVANGFSDEKEFFALLHKDTADAAMFYAQAVDELVCRFESPLTRAQLDESVLTCLIHRQEALILSDSNGIAFCPRCKGLQAEEPGNVKDIPMGRSNEAQAPSTTPELPPGPPLPTPFNFRGIPPPCPPEPLSFFCVPPTDNPPSPPEPPIEPLDLQDIHRVPHPKKQRQKNPRPRKPTRGSASTG